MYDTRKDEELRGSAVGPFLPRAVAEQGGWESELVLCCGYRPTLVSPGSIISAYVTDPPSLNAQLNIIIIKTY